MGEKNKRANWDLQLFATVLPRALFSEKQGSKERGQVKGILFHKGLSGFYRAGLNVQFNLNDFPLMISCARPVMNGPQEDLSVFPEKRTVFQGYTARIEVTEEGEGQERKIFLREINRNDFFAIHESGVRRENLQWYQADQWGFSFFAKTGKYFGRRISRYSENLPGTAGARYISILNA